MATLNSNPIDRVAAGVAVSAAGGGAGGVILMG